MQFVDERLQDPMLLEFACASGAAAALQQPLSSPSPRYDRLGGSGDLGGRCAQQGEEDLFDPGVQDHGPNSLEQLADHVHQMVIDIPPAVAAAADEQPDGGRANFLRSVFTAIPPAQLQVPDPVQHQPPPAPPSRRQSNRLLARPSSVPVSRRATRSPSRFGWAGGGHW